MPDAFDALMHFFVFDVLESQSCLFLLLWGGVCVLSPLVKTKLGANTGGCLLFIFYSCRGVYNFLVNVYTANLVFSSSSWVVPRFSTQFWNIWIAGPTATPLSTHPRLYHPTLCAAVHVKLSSINHSIQLSHSRMNIHTFDDPCSDWSSCILVPHFIHAHTLPCGSLSTGGLFRVISFPRPAGNAGKCVISLLLLSINDLINITLYYSTIAAMHLNLNHQNKSKRLYSIIW